MLRVVAVKSVSAEGPETSRSTLVLRGATAANTYTQETESVAKTNLPEHH